MARSNFLVVCVFMMLNAHQVYVSALLNITQEALDFGNKLIHEVEGQSTYKSVRDMNNKLKIITDLLYEFETKISQARDEVSQIDRLHFFENELSARSNLLAVNKDMYEFRKNLSKIFDWSIRKIKWHMKFGDEAGQTLIDLCNSQGCQIFESVQGHALGWDEGNIKRYIQNHLKLPNEIDRETRKTFIDIVIDSPQVYGWAMSKQLILFYLLNIIAVADATGYAMMQYSYAALKVYHNAEHLLRKDQIDAINEIKAEWLDRDINDMMFYANNDFVSANTANFKTFKIAMINASRKLRRTDEVYKSDRHVKLNKVFQKYIINEVDLNEDGSCKKDCPAYNQSKIYGCYDKGICAHQRTCDGNLWECNDQMSSSMHVCPTYQKGKYKSAVYDFIEVDGQRYGELQSGKCNRDPFETKTWPRGFYRCSYCVCTCDNANISDGVRYFNLRSTTSDVDSNYIVTDARLRENNNVIHIQIQQAKLLANGMIDSTVPLRWRDLENYTISDKNIINGKDYHTITWNERTVLLDQLEGPKNHVVTGLKFSLKNGFLKLEIRLTQFNFTTGKLADSHWMSNSSMENDLSSRNEVQLNNVNKNVISSNGHEYLRFTASDVNRDAGQTTIPYIDTQSLNSIKTPFSGVGLVHKSIENIGHFLALDFVSYDFVPHLKE